MKKFVKVIGLMSMAAMFAVSTSSCKKAEENAEFTVSLGRMHEDPSNRAYFDQNGIFRWNNGDKIMVYNLASNGQSVAHEFTALPGAQNQPKARFRGRPVGPKKDLGFRYFYPAERASGQLENNRETFTVLGTQNYNLTYGADPKALVMAVSVNSISDDFTMEHIFGVLNLRVNTTRTDMPVVKEIIVEDKAFNLYGNLSLNLGAIENSDRFTELLNSLVNNDPDYATDMATYLQSIGYYEHNNGAGKTMTLDFNNVNDGNQYGKGVELTGEQKNFRIILRPGALYRGFKVTIKFMNPGMQDYVFDDYWDVVDVNNVIKPAWLKSFDITVD